MLVKQMLRVLPSFQMLRCPRSFALTARLTVSQIAEATFKAGEAFAENAGGQCGESPTQQVEEGARDACEMVISERQGAKMQEQTRRRIGRGLFPRVSIWLLISTTVTYAAGGLREPRASLLLGQMAVLASGWLCARVMMAGSR